MGFWSGVGSALSSACSSIGSALSSACSSVLSGISNIVSNAGTIMTALAIAIPVTGALAKAIAAIDIISKILGMLEPNETTEDIGDRAIQAQEAGISPEDYATYKEYMVAIKSFELDPKKSAEYSETEKMLAGVGVQYWGFEEKFGVGTGELLTKTVESPDYFTGDRLASFLDKVESISDVVQYFDGKLSSNERNAVEAKLIEAEKAINPEKSNADIFKELDTYRHE